MDTLREIETVFGVLITGGVAARLIYCLIMAAGSDDAQVYRKRARHALVFLVLAVSVRAVAAVILAYYT